MSGITDPAEPYFKDGQWGWDGTVWRKLPMVFGYSALAGEDLSNTNLAIGSNYLIGATVDPGEIWIIQQISILYVGTVPTEIRVFSNGTPGTPILLSKMAPTSGVWYYGQCSQILAAGDHIRGEVYGATATDDLYFRYSGYKMKIAE